MKPIPRFENDFYHDGRGPELQKVRWGRNGIILRGFEYYNPDDEHTEGNLRYLRIDKLEVYSMAGEEVHGNILANGKTTASIFEVPKSKWLSSFNQSHLKHCEHYQIMFYDEIYDVICGELLFGQGRLV